MERLSGYVSPAFPYLGVVCRAYVERFSVGDVPGRPGQVVRDIVGGGNVDFGHVFKEFSRREGIYGMGDPQVKALYDRVMHTD